MPSLTSSIAVTPARASALPASTSGVGRRVALEQLVTQLRVEAAVLALEQQRPAADAAERAGDTDAVARPGAVAA